MFQKRILNTFVNSVFVFDDEWTITFNYSGDGRTVTLKDITENSEGGEFVSCIGCSTIMRQVEPLYLCFRGRVRAYRQVAD